MKEIILGIFIFCSINLYAQPAGYNFGKQILIQSSQVSGSTSHTDFPVLISFTDSDLRTTINGGNVENTNGFDIVFTQGDCSTLLDHEIEKYNPVTGEYIAWVKVPLISPAVNTGIHMYYGNSSISSDPSTTNVWSNGFVGVWHMAEDPSSAAPQINESTSNNFDATSTGAMTSGDLVTSQIGDGLDFEGTNDGLTRADNSTLDVGTNDLTLSAWVRLDNVTTNNRKEIINKKNGGFSTNGYAIRTRGANIEIAHKATGQTNTNTISSSPINISVSTWTYISVTFNVPGDSATIHVNGVAEPSISINAGNSLANGVQLEIGKKQTGNYMNGRIDEPRVATVSRTTDWILTEYNNQNSPSTFYAVSAEMTAATLCAVLPIELLNFNAYLVDNEHIKLNWQTASEINNDYFTIERTKNGTDWQELTKLNGAGNSSALQSYSSFDNNPYYGISYYRLKQTDFNGKFSYSQIRSVNIERGKNSSIEIYPNPAHDKITIIGSEIELSEISIYNSLGQNVTALSKQIINNSTISIIDISQLSQGIYYIKTKTTANKMYKQ